MRIRKYNEVKIMLLSFNLIALFGKIFSLRFIFFLLEEERLVSIIKVLKYFSIKLRYFV